MAENYGDVYSITKQLENLTKRLVEIRVPGLYLHRPKLIGAYQIGNYYVISDDDTPHKYTDCHLQIVDDSFPFLVRAVYKGEMYYIFSNEKEYPSWIKMR